MKTSKASLYVLSNPSLRRKKTFKVKLSDGFPHVRTIHVHVDDLESAIKAAAIHARKFENIVAVHLDNCLVWDCDWHTSATGNNPVLNVPIYGTQGGGSVYWDQEAKEYKFWESPQEFEFRRHDPMPREWGVGGFIKDVDFYQE